MVQLRQPPGATLPRPGDVVAGKYLVDQRLGSGAMSVVYRATHRVTEKRFALKVLLPEVAAHDELAQRFLREAQVASRIEHRHVVEVYDVGVFDGAYFMVMELLEGESLDDRLRREGTLPLSEVGRLLVPCMEALALAHAAGIVHRDLKPANIFVCRASRSTPEYAKVLDFGISKMAGLPGEPKQSMTRTGLVMGTAHYMPLEQMRGQQVDRRADIYALGVVIYQMLSGRLPYRAGNFGDLVLAMASEPPTPLEESVRDLPAGFSAVVHRALERAPEARFPDIEAMLAALAPFLRTARERPAPPRRSPKSDERSAPPPRAAGAANGNRPPPLPPRAARSADRDRPPLLPLSAAGSADANEGERPALRLDVSQSGPASDAPAMPPRAARTAGRFEFPRFPPRVASSADVLEPGRGDGRASDFASNVPSSEVRRQWLLGIAVGLGLLLGAVAAVTLVVRSPPLPLPPRKAQVRSEAVPSAEPPAIVERSAGPASVDPAAASSAAAGSAVVGSAAVGSAALSSASVGSPADSAFVTPAASSASIDRPEDAPLRPRPQIAKSPKSPPTWKPRHTPVPHRSEPLSAPPPDPRAHDPGPPVEPARADFTGRLPEVYEDEF